jgi:hypothetical protein
VAFKAKTSFPDCSSALVRAVPQYGQAVEQSLKQRCSFGSAQESVKVLNWRGFLKSAFPSLQDVSAIMAAGMATE